MGRGIIKLPLACIPGMLKLPEEYKAVSAAYDMQNEIMQIIVEHESIPEVSEGAIAPTLPTVTPIYRQEYNEVTLLDSVEVR